MRKVRLQKVETKWLDLPVEKISEDYYEQGRFVPNQPCLYSGRIPEKLKPAYTYFTV